MTLTEALTAIRASTEHEDDTQVTDTQLKIWVGLEVDALRAELSQIAPSLYVTVSATQVLTTADPAFDLPADFLALIRFERLEGTEWFPVDASDEHAPDRNALNFREQGDDLIVSPAANAAGSYRAVYVPKHTAIGGSTDGATTLAIPDGCRDVVLERVCARVRERLDEDPSPHIRRSEATWSAQRGPLSRRYGRHPVPGLRRVMGW